MIRYALLCASGHAFDSWFPGSDAYDEQVRRGLVECPACRSTDIRKSIMAPRLAKGATDPLAQTQAPSVPDVTGQSAPAPVLDERLAALRAAVREMRTAIARHTTDVGAAFPDEARRMHTGEIDARPIRGEATHEEARELLEDGVPILPVPMLPDDRN